MAYFDNSHKILICVINCLIPTIIMIVKAPRKTVAI